MTTLGPRFLLAALALAGALSLASAHDSWISRGGHRNAAGEWWASRVRMRTSQV
jgi:hypothetical protein